MHAVGLGSSVSTAELALLQEKVIMTRLSFIRMRHRYSVQQSIFLFSKKKGIYFVPISPSSWGSVGNTWFGVSFKGKLVSVGWAVSSPDAVWVSAGLTRHPFRASAHPPQAEVPPPSALYSAYWVSSRFLRGGWELIVGSWRAPPALGKMRSFLEMKLDMLGKKAKGYPCTWLKYGRFTSIPSGLGWSPRALQWDDQKGS